MSCRGVVFDLDGTLLDTLADLADSMNAVLISLGQTPHAEARYRYFVGDGMEMLARRALGLDTGEDEQVSLCMERMAAEYASRWHHKTRPYAGVPEMLDALKARGIPMSVFSNKPDSFTLLTVQKLLPGWFFSPVRGAREGFPRKPDPLGALEIAAELRLEPKEIAYVGDTNTDMKTATAAGMLAIGVSWGFREADELTASGAACVIDHPSELPELLD
jgi:phosphoglycolate phosphatase